MQMFLRSTLAAACLTSFAAIAAPPADAPAGTMGKCKDGTYSSSPHKQGACKGHKGVGDWYTSDAGTAPAAAVTSTTPSGSTLDTEDVNPAKATAKTSPATTTSSAVQAPGGGAGQVWINSSTKVYHCSGDKWYGKTKAGEYMSEFDAKAKGFHGDHGKSCS